jgi:hypothetical protein
MGSGIALVTESIGTDVSRGGHFPSLLRAFLTNHQNKLPTVFLVIYPQ